MPDSPRLRVHDQEPFLGLIADPKHSLSQLIENHGTVLVIDTSSSVVHVGVLGRDRARWVRSELEASAGLYACMGKLGCHLEDFGAFTYCEGPGSILGVRTAAMAVRTWRSVRPQPVFSYRSLELFLAALSDPVVTAFIDARRGAWHAIRRDAQNPTSEIQRVTAADLSGKLVMPSGFRAWSPLPDNTTTQAYDLPAMMERCASHGLFRTSDQPEAHTSGPIDYVTWSPKIHRPATTS